MISLSVIEMPVLKIKVFKTGFTKIKNICNYYDKLYFDHFYKLLMLVD